MPDLHPTFPLLALRRDDAARAIGVSVRTLDSMISDGRLGPPGLRFGKEIRVWPVEELRAWLAAGAPPREIWSQLSVKEPPSCVEANGYSGLLDRCSESSQLTSGPFRFRQPVRLSMVGAAQPDGPPPRAVSDGAAR